jgi:hypothetical protein
VLGSSRTQRELIYRKTSVMLWVSRSCPNDWIGRGVLRAGFAGRS